MEQLLYHLTDPKSLLQFALKSHGHYRLTIRVLKVNQTEIRRGFENDHKSGSIEFLQGLIFRPNWFVVIREKRWKELAQHHQHHLRKQEVAFA